MKDYLKEFFKSFKNDLKNYGRVITFIFLIFINIIFIYQIAQILIPQKLKVSFLDIGQGDAIFVETPSGKKMLIDGGGSNLILEKLNNELSFFDREIDMIVATHPDTDHVTGLIPVLQKYSVKNILTSPIKSNTGVFLDLEKKITEEDARIIKAEKGDEINFGDGVTAKILWPKNNYKEKKNDTNDASISMIIFYGSKRFLLTGDLPKEREGGLIYPSSKNITIYKAGHHGSKTSSGEVLLSYIRPEYAIISAGKNNKYGHPNSETLERLKKYAKETISTIDRGTITFFTNGENLEIKTQK